MRQTDRVHVTKWVSLAMLPSRARIEARANGQIVITEAGWATSVPWLVGAAVVGMIATMCWAAGRAAEWRAAGTLAISLGVVGAACRVRRKRLAKYSGGADEWTIVETGLISSNTHRVPGKDVRVCVCAFRAYPPGAVVVGGGGDGIQPGGRGGVILTVGTDERRVTLAARLEEHELDTIVASLPELIGGAVTRTDEVVDGIGIAVPAFARRSPIP